MKDFCKELEKHHLTVYLKLDYVLKSWAYYDFCNMLKENE